MELREEINKLSVNKRKYFLYKNKIDTAFTRYSEWNEEDFIKNTKATDRVLNNLNRWEDTEEYKKLQFKRVQENFNTDILEVYESIKKQALEGNATAVKVMIELQGNINKIYGAKGQKEEETGYILDL